VSPRIVIIVASGLAVAAAVGLGVYLAGPKPAVEETVANRRPAVTPARPAPAPVPASPEAPAASPRTPSTTAPEPVEAEPAPEPEPVATEAVAEAGTLRIDADVPGAQVFIDRQYIGTAPVTADNVRPGTHQLNVSAEGFDGVAQTIDVEPGPREITIRLREVRLDVALDVIHKHGIGSCRGRLVATAQGLRYETTNKDDSFTVPLSGLETFQVDYLEKNLRVKLQKGRQFNFTDPEGNSDRLFVFHRDVERARERLSKGFTPPS
jgi:hypothetical protein